MSTRHIVINGKRFPKKGAKIAEEISMALVLFVIGIGKLFLVTTL